MVGLSARISEFNPALALSNFQHMDDLVAERIRLINLYRRLLSGVSGISFQAFPPDRQSSGIHMVIRVAQTAFGLSRDELQQQLLSERIESRKYFSPPVHSQKVYAGYDTSAGLRLTVTEAVAEQTLVLPLYCGMGEETVVKIGDVIRSVHGRCCELAKRRWC